MTDNQVNELMLLLGIVIVAGFLWRAMRRS